MIASGQAIASGAAVIAGAATMAAVLVLGASARPSPAQLDTRRRVAAIEPSGGNVAAPARATPRLVPVAAVVLLAASSSAIAGVAPTLVAGGVGALLWRRRRWTGRRTAVRQVEAALPDATELFVLCIHAGRSPTQAIGELARRAPPAVRPAFAEVELQLHRGCGLADALAALPRLLGPTARELAVAVATADREGLPLAPMLDRLTEAARTARRRLGDADARRLPIRLAFPLVLCTLPAFVLLAIAPAVLGALSTLRGNAP